jgi:hypothetical protein
LKITYEHEGQYHKGFLGLPDGVYQFVYKSHVNKRKEDWSVPLPNLPSTWVDLCVEGILLPGHISHTFLCSPVSQQQTMFDPVASFVSALNLHKECPPTLLKALADSHPDRAIWLKSYSSLRYDDWPVPLPPLPPLLPLPPRLPPPLLLPLPLSLPPPPQSPSPLSPS